MKKSYKETFGKHALIPVIHVHDEKQAIEETTLCMNEGCDGVFLINHYYDARHLKDVFYWVHEEFPDFWIGINYLGIATRIAFDLLDRKVSGIWVDNAGVHEDAPYQSEAHGIYSSYVHSKHEGLYFGGVAFKYQTPVSDLEKVSKIAMSYMDVITTSGEGTGKAAGREKILTMRKAIGDFPLAIASGITPENITDYLGVADCFLVATGISKTFTEIDPEKLKSLINVIKEWDSNESILRR